MQRLLILVFVFGLAAACGGGSGGKCAPGTEKCECYGNLTCNGGLICLSNLCVNSGSGGSPGRDSGTEEPEVASPTDTVVAPADIPSVPLRDSAGDDPPSTFQQDLPLSDAPLPVRADADADVFSDLVRPMDGPRGDAIEAAPAAPDASAPICGDRVLVIPEQCDDGNTVPFDGCSSDCRREPVCSGAGPCTSICGDGLVIGDGCDDGNTADGDGCSTDCKVEAGWKCAQPETGERMVVPAIFRDFRFQNPSDFEAGVSGGQEAVTGMVKQALDSDGKPTYTELTGGHVESQNTFAMWYRNTDGVNHPNPTTVPLWRNADGNYVNRYGENGEQWNITTPANYCGTVADAMLDADGNPIPCTFKYQYDPDTNPTGGKTDCQKMEDLGYTQLPGSCHAVNGTYVALYIVEKVDGNPLFFPVDDDPFSAGENSSAHVFPPFAPAATYPYDVDSSGTKRMHNFSFTSEIHYWLRYDATKTYVLTFLGDNDVWVFVNKKLALDLGGIHSPVSATLTLDSTLAAKLGLSDDAVYEVAIFHAERQTTGSALLVTLPGFNTAPSTCTPL